MEPIENYQALAAAIVKVACADYIDARIVMEYGMLSPSKKRKELYEQVIRYGERRYCYVRQSPVTKKAELKRGSEKKNIRMLMKLKESFPENRKQTAKQDAKELEEFFRSEWFSVLMPNTDVNWLIRTLRGRAHAQERIMTDYGEKGE